MLFSELMEAELENELCPIVENLLEVKKNTSEIGEGNRIDELNEYIDAQLEELKHKADGMDREKPVEWQRLDDIFLRLLGK